MQTADKHIINKVVLEVNTSSQKQAFDLKDRLDVFLKEELFPILATYFDQYAIDVYAETIQFDRLDIDVEMSSRGSLVDYNELKFQLVKKIKAQFDEQFQKGHFNSNSYEVLSENDKRFRSFVHFINSGIDPWWESQAKVANYGDSLQLMMLLSEPSNVAQLKRQIREERFRERLIKQLTDSQLELLLDAILKHDDAAQLVSRASFNQILTSGLFKRIKVVKSQTARLQSRQIFWEMAFELGLGMQQSSSLEAKRTRTLISLTIDHQIKEELNLWVSAKDELAVNRIQKVITPVSEFRIDTFELLVGMEEMIIPLEVALWEEIENIKTGISLDQNRGDDTEDTIEFRLDFSNDQEDENKEIGVDLEKKTPTDDQSVFDVEFIEEQAADQIEGQELIAKIYAEGIESHSTKAWEESVLNDFLSTHVMRYETPEDNYLVKHAGLLLVHPFLKQLFENCQLLDENNKINNPELAIHLLGYLATGELHLPENQLLFEKFLCNVPLETPINRQIMLSERMKEDADELLEAVLRYWQKMENSSPDLLRNEFLQRSGKLILNEEHPKIVVEKKTQDILLKSVDWNLSLIKLPWKEKMIFLDW